MLTYHLVLVLAVVLLAFAVAWRMAPQGYLTAGMSTFGAFTVAMHEAFGGMMPELKAVLPEEYRPVLVIVYLLLTATARFRSKLAAK